MKILLAIANHGTGNRSYLDRLINEYQRMPWPVDIVICSNIPKEFGAGVEVRVGVPTRDPWSLPFAHKAVFGERVEDYGLFIYSEDDTLITERNIRAFLSATEVLPENELAGFLRTEQAADGSLHFPEVHGHFHWDLASVRSAGGRTFAHYTDEHSACYMLTQGQLKHAIASGGFLLQPHEGRYDLMVTAATDPYTRCGFRKMVCISHLDEFTVPHLPNKYIGRIGVAEEELRRQIDALMQIDTQGRPKTRLFGTETKLPRSRWSKSYYEKHCSRLTELIPQGARSVLSIGMGSGEMEEHLLKGGRCVTGIPLDSVIGACAAARGVEVIYGGFEEARLALGERRFDCLLLSNVLHLVKQPEAVLRQFIDLLAEGGVTIAMVPNLAQLSVTWRRMAAQSGYRDLTKFDQAGVHVSSMRWLKKLLSAGGLQVNGEAYEMSTRRRWAARSVSMVSRGLAASDVIVSATR